MKALETKLLDILLKNFQHHPLTGQLEFLSKFSSFLIQPASDGIFILKGYAGTGKTSLVRSIIKSLSAAKLKSVLLAPTGRAAKVLGNYSGKKAQTIHSKIYRITQNQFGGVYFKPASNPHTDTLFVVDEASMIHGTDSKNVSDENNDVLHDLMQYVFSGENCKLLLIGDTAQLPPVGVDLSPALSKDYISNRYFMDLIFEHELTEVARQHAGSNILKQATKLRNHTTSETGSDFPKISCGDDVELVNGDNFTDKLNSSYSKQGFDNSIIITRSNKKANQYNLGLRSRVLYKEEELCAGDILMVVKNNYFWLPEGYEAGFIANGDFLEVQRIRNIRERHGYRFADAVVSMTDYPDQSAFEVTLILDTLTIESANLGWESGKKLYESVAADYEDLPKGKKRMEAIRKDVYLNALQVKFGYAITCHKAQGGQWNHVYLDHGWLGESALDREFTRWLYTGFTRAKEKLYLVNFSPLLVKG